MLLLERLSESSSIRRQTVDWTACSRTDLSDQVPSLDKRFPVNDAADVLAFDQHVGFADGIRFCVEFLAIHDQPGVRVETAEMFFSHRQHAAGSCGGIIQGSHDAGFGQGFIVFDEQQVDHQPDDFTRREVFPGGFVGQFRELADQFFKHACPSGRC
jgi:hypothetical protein